MVADCKQRTPSGRISRRPVGEPARSLPGRRDFPDENVALSAPDFTGSGRALWHSIWIKKLALALLLVAVATGATAAGQRSYRASKISNGQIFSCEGSWFQGTAIVYTDR